MPEAAVRDLVARRYAAEHGARACLDFPDYRVIAASSRPRAALGVRRAAETRLFLEAYLDTPVEAAVSAAFGRPVPRAAIVELGDHASCHGSATLALWTRTAFQLSSEAEIAAAVLTAPLRHMFERMGLPFRILAPADPARLRCGGAEWGRYYEHQPMVCAGEIEAGRRALAAWAAGRREARA